MKITECAKSHKACVYCLVFPDGKRYVGKTRDLGDRVKIYLKYATDGVAAEIKRFGIENVDGMHGHIKRHTQEEANRIAEEQEKAAERQDRRNRYYGNEGNNLKYKRRPHIYLFHSEDLDNDNVIAKVEDTPTYKRTKEILESINSLSYIKETKVEPVVEEPKEASPGTIKFL